MVRDSRWLKKMSFLCMKGRMYATWRQECSSYPLIKDISWSYASLYDTSSDSVARCLVQPQFLINNLVHFPTFSFSHSVRQCEIE